MYLEAATKSCKYRPIGKSSKRRTSALTRCSERMSYPMMTEMEESEEKES